MLHQRLCDENRRKKVWIRRYHRLGFCDAFFGWMVTKRLYLQIKARFFSLMYFCESLCINRISHNYVIPQFLFCIIMPFRTSFHIPFRKLIPPFTLTDNPDAEEPWGLISDTTRNTFWRNVVYIIRIYNGKAHLKRVSMTLFYKCACSNKLKGYNLPVIRKT